MLVCACVPACVCMCIRACVYMRVSVRVPVSVPACACVFRDNYTCTDIYANFHEYYDYIK